jgi:hypothetical protein
MHSHGLRRASARFGSRNVVAQRGHRLPAKLEVHGEFRRGDRCAGRTLAFERGADFAVELRPNRQVGVLVEHLAKERMSERIRQLCCIVASLGTRGDEPQLLAREIVTCLADPCGVSLERSRDRIDAELDAANCGDREHQALIAGELRDVMIDDGREILRNRDCRELRRPGCRVATGWRGARDRLRHHRRDEQRYAVGAFVQGAHERFIGGDRW